MAQPAVDISLLGDKELERKLARLATPAAQKKAIRPAMRKSTKRIRPRIVANVSGHPVGIVSGELLAAMSTMPVRAIKRSRTIIGAVLELPEGKDIRIKINSIEYGHVRGAGRTAAPPHPFIRPAVDSNRESELARIGVD
ncbi:hypothetical protein LCGC14_1967130, partial [marine sediment metagenome]